ncbi:MAG TPA: TorF family putative porin [Malonomonas sp.]
MNQLRKTGVMLAFLLALSVGLVAVASAEVEFEGDVYVGVFDKYLWRGFDLSGSQPVVQGGADFSAAGFTLSVWSNAQLSSDAGEGIDSGWNETDLTLDYTFDLNETVSVSLGNVYYLLDEADDTNEAYLSVGLNTILNPALTVYWDWDKSEADGLFYVLSIGHDIEISDALTLSLSASVGYNQENYSVSEDFSGWQNAEFGASLDYAMTEQLFLSPTFLYSAPISDDAEDLAGIDDEMAVGLTITFSF